MPTVSYGSTYGGIPVASVKGSTFDGRPVASGNYKNDYTQWCLEMGFDGPASVTTRYESFNGAVMWCNQFDDSAYKWCDLKDGYWKDKALGLSMMGDRIQELQCNAVDNGKNTIYFRLFRLNYSTIT